MDNLPLFPLYVVFFLALAFSAFFSGTEAAFLSVQRYKIRSAASRGVRGAQRAARLSEHPENFLPTVLVGNNLVNTIAATVGTLIAVQTIRNESVSAVVAAVAVAGVLIIFGETLPKTLAARNAEAAAIALSAPLIWAERLFTPVVYPLQKFNRWITGLLSKSSPTATVTREELKLLISLNREAGGIDETQANLLLRTLRLTDLRVRDVMTPRTEVVSVSEDLNVAQFLEFNARQYHSRFPVFKRGSDDVTGVLEARDVFRALSAGDASSNDPIAELASPAQFVWESKPVVDTIAEMQRTDADMAMVVDEFGSMVGLVTFHHLLAQVVGRGRQQILPAGQDAAPGKGYSLKGSTRIYEANESVGLDLPEGEYDTVAGFVTSRLGRLPRTGDKVSHGAWEIEVVKMAGPRVVEIQAVRRV